MFGPVLGPVTSDDIEDFRDAWREYDPSGTSLIASRDVLPLLQQVKWPLGLAGRAAEWSAENPDKTMMWMGALDIPDHGGYALFHEVLLAVVHVHGEQGVQVPICDPVMQLLAVWRSGRPPAPQSFHHRLTMCVVFVLTKRSGGAHEAPLWRVAWLG